MVIIAFANGVLGKLGFYTKHKEEKYYTSFYDKIEPRNDILDTFRPMKEVVLGEIR